MSESLRIDDLTEDETVALNYNLKQIDEHTPRNELRSAYYDGKRAVKQIGTVIPPQYSNLGIALRASRA